MKKIITTLLIIMCASMLAGCTYSYEVIEKDTDTAAVEFNYESGQTQVIDEIAVKGEPFKLVCKYDTGDYSLDS